MAQSPPGMKFFIGGVVHRDQAGLILEALYLSGAEKLDIAPFANLVPIPQPGMKHKLVNGKSALVPMQIEGAGQKKVPATTARPPRQPDRGTAAEFAMKVLAKATKPMKAADIAKSGKGKFTLTAISQALVNWQQRGLFNRVGKGAYVLADQRAAPSPKGKTARAGKPETGGATEQVLKKLLDTGAPMPLQQIIAAFPDHPGRIISAAVMRLKKMGLVNNPSRAVYEATAKAKSL